MNDEISASGRFPMIPPETQEAMRSDRMTGMTLEQIAEKYHCSVNSVRKYTGDVIKARQPQAKIEVNTETDINSEVEKTVLSQHAGRILNYSKKRDSEIIAAGDVVQKHLADKGINIDIDQIPPAQLIKLLKSPLGDDMNVNMKGIFENWLEQQLSLVKTGSPAVQEKTGKISFEDIKEMMMLNFLGKMANQGDSPPQDNSQVDKLIAENEKLRQDFKAEMEKNRQEMKDLIMEKRLLTMEEKQSNIADDLSAQLESLQNNIVQIKSIPNPSPEQRTALSELSDAASKLNEVKSSLIQLGLVQATPGTVVMQSPEAYKNADGSTDYVRYAGDKLESTVKLITGALSKQAPDRKFVQETPPPAETLPERQMTYEEYHNVLLSKESLTPADQKWIQDYNGYLARKQAAQAAQQTTHIPQHPPEGRTGHVTQPAEQPPEQVPEEPQTKTGMIERLQEMEKEEIRRGIDHSSLGVA